jgi:acyl-CoA synthetase (NDP forming)
LPQPSAAPRITVARILDPERVAVFGASDDRSKWAGRIMHYLALHGYRGEVVPINPRRESVQGKRCYARIGDAPAVDVAIIAIPAPKVPETLRECAAAGVGCCVVISSGFGEVGGDGPALQDEAVAIARASGMRLIGPNCLGLVNVLNGMAMTSARVLDVERMIKGEIGLVSQSGALMLSLFDRANDAGIGLSQFISVGNQADLELCDFFEHMIDDAATRVICLHIEGLKTGGAFSISPIERAARASRWSRSRPGAAPRAARRRARTLRALPAPTRSSPRSAARPASSSSTIPTS